jgi:hypothetical protein
MITKQYFVILVTLLCIHSCHCIGTNDAIADNDLGQIASQCSRYCSQKDGLELWLSIEWHCHNKYAITNAKPYASNTVRRKLNSLKSRRKLSTGLLFNWSGSTSGIVCAILSIIGTIIGIIIGRNLKPIIAFRSKEHEYSQLSTDDTDLPPSLVQQKSKRNKYLPI